jgi:membrane protease YdiL (CAAX protease family)
MVTVTATSSATFRPVRNSWIGLCVALFALLLIWQVFRVINPTLGTGLFTARELLMFASAAGLLVLVSGGENLPFTSVGLGAAAWWKSILWGLLAAVVCGGAAVIMVKVLRLNHAGSSATFDRSPLWLVTLIMFRAGMVEELFYRGYAIERFRAMGLGKLVSAAIPLIIFAASTIPAEFRMWRSPWSWADSCRDSFCGGGTL